MEDVVINQVYSATSTDLSFLSLFSNATLMVKLVIIVLVSLSIYSWAVIIQKFSFLREYSKQHKEFYKAFWHAETVGKIYKSVANKKDLYSRLFIQSFDEYKFYAHKAKKMTNFGAEMRENIDRIFRLESYMMWDTLDTNMDFLASIGSATPFIGLLGTVWGIMDSFSQIGLTKNASLAVVAPGIAEALFTTALGLIVTIPAVIGYNKIMGQIKRHVEQLDNYADQLKDLFAKDGTGDE